MFWHFRLRFFYDSLSLGAASDCSGFGLDSGQLTQPELLPSGPAEAALAVPSSAAAEEGEAAEVTDVPEVEIDAAAEGEEEEVKVDDVIVEAQDVE